MTTALKPYPFQEEGIAFLAGANGRALIADEMGLGKTIQALGYLARNPQLRPAIILCPAAVKLKWKAEIERWVGAEAVVLQGHTIKDLDPHVPFYVLNYDILYSWLPKILKIAPKALVADEIHYCKEQKSRRSKAVAQLSKATQSVIGLSGTPVMNKPAELWHPLNIINPLAWPSWWAFISRYCDLRYESVPITSARNPRPPGKVDIERMRMPSGHMLDMWVRKVAIYNGSSNTDELVRRLRPMMVRRLKRDVTPDLPEKTRITVPVSIKGEYRKLEKEGLASLKKRLKNKDLSLGVAIDLLAKMRMALGLAKLEAAKEFITDTLSMTDRLVVFAHHHDVVQSIYLDWDGQAAKIVGGQSMTERQKAIDSFRNGEVPLLIVSTRAGGIGIDLTEADTSLTIELDYNPAMHLQAEDRLHRIGQKKPVWSYYMVGENTMDEPLLAMLERKSKVSASILADPEEDFVNELSTWVEGRFE